MPPPLLYSTNVALKFLIQETYRKDLHYVWCSESFDANSHPRYSIQSYIAPSSSPYAIYKDLKAAVEKYDRHCSKISMQKTSFKSLAYEWEKSGEISREEKEEIVLMTDEAPFREWRPLIYVIPRALVESRLITVPLKDRASWGLEYIIPDLRRDEFNIIDLVSHE